MPRHKKWRKVCCMPRCTEFTPLSKDNNPLDAVILSLDEYETIRLIDHENFTQEECSGFMKIARTTVQQIYNEARKKLSVALVEGKTLCIKGGEYRLCDGKESNCKCGGCKKHRSKGDQSEDTP